MVYFNEPNDLKKLERALVAYKKRMQSNTLTSMEANIQGDDEAGAETSTNKKLKNN